MNLKCACGEPLVKMTEHNSDGTTSTLWIHHEPVPRIRCQGASPVISTGDTCVAMSNMVLQVQQQMAWLGVEVAKANKIVASLVELLAADTEDGTK